MDKKEIIKTAPRIPGAAAEWYPGLFESLNQGLEFIIEAFPTLYKRALDEIKGKFLEGELLLMVDVFNATYLLPQILGTHLDIQVSDGCALDGLDQKWGVMKNPLLDKIAALTSFQAACLELFVVGFWHGGHWEKMDPREYVKEVKG